MIARHGPSQNGDEAGALFRAREREREIGGWGVRRGGGGGSGDRRGVLHLRFMIYGSVQDRPHLAVPLVLSRPAQQVLKS